jgi:peptidoglycan/LPS O-acetylase OafA/YrhL
MRQLGRRPELDGLRAIAILLVLTIHGFSSAHPWLGGAGLGVDLFFVLSGFLITTLLLEEHAREGRLSLKRFYGRRARRLLPALLAMLAVTGIVLVATGTESAFQETVAFIFRASYISNFLIAFTGGGVGLGFVHLWSLAQEEQFYVLWPLILLVFLRRRTSPWRVVILLAAAIVVLNLQRILVIDGGAPWRRVWFAPDTHSDPILFGCAAAVVWRYGLVRLPRAAAVVASLVAVAMIAVLRTTDASTYPVAIPLFALAAAVLILGVLDHPAHFPARALRLPVLRGLGKISYGLYLWHYPLIAYFGVRGIPVAILAAAVSYRFVEQPFLRRSDRPQPAESIANRELQAVRA